MQWLPESARYDVARGQPDKAYATLKRIADENGKPMPLGRLIDASEQVGERKRERERERGERERVCVCRCVSVCVCVCLCVCVMGGKRGERFDQCV